jgi:hypothetical protein
MNVTVHNGRKVQHGLPQTEGADPMSARTVEPGQHDTGLAEAIAAELLAHPAVVTMSGGPLGVLATHLPGRKVNGVRVRGAGEPIEIGVILRLGDPLPKVTEELRARVRALAGEVRVDVTVADIQADSADRSDKADTGDEADAGERR